MILKSIEVTGLLGRRAPLKARFNADLNIVTGRNGAGKTTFLKLCWYLASGSINLAVAEIEFDTVILETDKYKLTLKRLAPNLCTAVVHVEGEEHEIEDEMDEDEIGVVRDARDIISELVSPFATTLFFPTFRRIEGGFSMPRNKTSVRGRIIRESRDLEEAMAGLSRALSHGDNTFVSSISTVDIEALLLKNYADLSEKYNLLQKTVSSEVIEDIRGYEIAADSDPTSGESGIKSAREVIDRVRAKIEKMESDRVSVMAPMTAIQKTVVSLFNHSGIKFGPRLSFGDAAEAISSEVLSAGEKQMLSFVCYNAFRSNSVTFIDEPELSLHVDWQRSLFPTLLAQNPTNQFIIATHSPFIYSLYPDKEICIDLEESRGDEQEIESVQIADS
ncbi:AAA family ATPase [Ascidiaceihabitans sp.]|uniref:AAA family ATPase n=1 Tax=Ascidiaceihabitans sp. TaxID=1872644 RepID=UPI003299FF68